MISRLVHGHVLDVAKKPLEEALRRYDPQLYLKWEPKKRRGQGAWELRRKPELKSLRAGRFVDSVRGRFYIPGDVYEFDGYTLAVPKYHETSAENHVKDFDRLSYEIVAWVAAHDAWNYGFRGKNLTRDAEYNEAKYLEREEAQAEEDRAYMIKQEKKAIREFREYVLSHGNPYRILDYWGK